MNALLTNFGTTGDVLPLAALGRELTRRGHSVTMAFAPPHRAAIERHHLRFAPVGPDLSTLQTEINRRWIDEEASYTSPSMLGELLRPLEAALPQTYEELRALARTADVLVSGPAQPAARMVHETTGVPFASVQFSHFGGSGTPALQAATASLINPFRRRLGLRPLANPVTIDANSPQLALYAISRHVLSGAASWPSHYRVVGFFLVQEPDWTPGTRLQQFLDAGPAPVVVSFGSMPHADPRALTAIIQEAVTMAGVRAVLQSSAVDPDAEGDALHVTGYAPHPWLFRQAACVVHHGGGGTAGAAFWSGKPTVFVPHGRIFDQHYLAQISAELGCSGGTIPIRELTAERLAASIAAALTAACGAAAARLGERVRSEHGVHAAAACLETLVENVGLAEETR